ncbi:hypothetical protein K402DRAFT_34463 [Aulographum hederae CBS 113979]|uniref:Uncharacterized protein n=1 Tax=Aulographum hederae CBS 113979 TaxID=1176131 RepID=A0A6G1H5W0_9PEZI|nr:hypothetical protein K402DRAFT_34463 [Aulographum hederae CBS 113979]
MSSSDLDDSMGVDAHFSDATSSRDLREEMENTNSAQPSPGDQLRLSADDSAPMNTAEDDKRDSVIVSEAGSSLKVMLGDLVGLVKTQAGAPVSVTGDFILQIGDRQSFKICISTIPGSETSELELDVQPLKRGGALSNGTELSNGRKRRRVDSPEAEDVEYGVPSTDQPAKPDNAKPENLTKPNDQSKTATNPPASEKVLSGSLLAAEPISETHITNPDVKNLSAQIRWVEQCRRIAAEDHDKREEKWRTTSATFHDDNRRKRESHDMWVAQELTKQTNLLVQVSNDVKGLYPLAHSMKWETPASFQVPQPSSMPPPGMQQVPRPSRNYGPASRTAPILNSKKPHKT